MSQEAPDIHLLMRQRASHMDNLQRLKDASKDWDHATAERGEATMANLMQQVYALDEQLRTAKGMRQYPAGDAA